MFKRFREDGSSDAQLLKTSRLEAEDVVGTDENLYCIEFVSDANSMSKSSLSSQSTGSSTLNINLLSRDETPYPAEEKDGYETYVTNYIDWANETEGIDQTKLTMRLLKR